jgi:hypothetical protein
MKLRLYKTENGYAFSIDGFSSIHHCGLIPRIQPTYSQAWQALKAAKEIYRKKAYHIDALRQKRYAIEDLSKPIIDSAPVEELLLNHYKTMLEEMTYRVMGIDDNAPDDKEMTYLVLVSQVSDLLRVKDMLKTNDMKVEVDKLIDKYRTIARKHFQVYLERDKREKEAADSNNQDVSNAQLPQEEVLPTEHNLTMASKKSVLSFQEMEELMEHYGNCICKAIAKHHPDVICKVSPKDGNIKLLGLDNGQELLNVTMNDRLNVDNIVPCSGLVEFSPAYSYKFYQRYWKPIVEAIGHFFLDDMDALILPEKSALPDMPNDSENFDIRGWNTKELKEIPLNLSFKEDVPIWILAEGKKIIKTAREYTEEDFLRTQPTRVRCIDPKLKLHGKIGEVVQVIPVNAGIGFEVDVNFGRKIVRLSKEQVEIVDEI